MLEAKKFEPLFEKGWWDKIGGFFETEQAEEIYKFLKERSRSGNTIFPSSDLTFRAFKETPYKDLKCLIIAMEPYSNRYNKVPIADGLALSCGLTKRIQPSLQTFLDAIENDCYKGLDFDKDSNYDLTRLASNGVLLTNVSLTVEENKIGSHSSKGLWLPFWEYTLNILNSCNSSLHYCLLGKEAQKLEKWILPFNNYIYKENHPSFYARTNSDWNTKMFSNINKIIEQNNGKSERITWFKEDDSDLPF